MKITYSRIYFNSIINDGKHVFLRLLWVLESCLLFFPSYIIALHEGNYILFWYLEI